MDCNPLGKVNTWEVEPSLPNACMVVICFQWAWEGSWSKERDLCHIAACATFKKYWQTVLSGQSSCISANNLFILRQSSTQCWSSIDSTPVHLAWAIKNISALAWQWGKRCPMCLCMLWSGRFKGWHFPLLNSCVYGLWPSEPQSTWLCCSFCAMR